MARRTRLWGLGLPGRPDGAHTRAVIPPVSGPTIVIQTYPAHFATECLASALMGDILTTEAEMTTELLAPAELT